MDAAAAKKSPNVSPNPVRREASGGSHVRTASPKQEHHELKSPESSTHVEHIAPEIHVTEHQEEKHEEKHEEHNVAALVKKAATLEASKETASAAPKSPGNIKRAASPSPTPRADKCDVCGKTVYEMEKMVADGKILHKTCLKCAQCNTTLTLGKYAALEGKFFCKPHFKQLFLEKGNYSEGFGEDKPTAKWAPQVNTGFKGIDVAVKKSGEDHHEEHHHVEHKHEEHKHEEPKHEEHHEEHKHEEHCCVPHEEHKHEEHHEEHKHEEHCVPHVEHKHEEHKHEEQCCEPHHEEHKHEEQCHCCEEPQKQEEHHVHQEEQKHEQHVEANVQV